MLETTLVLTAAVALGLVALAAAVFSAHLVAALGIALLVLGLLVGLPTGFWYHVALYRILSPRVPLPQRWWLSPSNLHVHLTDAERRRIRPWYRIGGVGFVFCLAGGLVAIVGLWLAR